MVLLDWLDCGGYIYSVLAGETPSCCMDHMDHNWWNGWTLEDIGFVIPLKRWLRFIEKCIPLEYIGDSSQWSFVIFALKTWLYRSLSHIHIYITWYIYILHVKSISIDFRFHIFIYTYSWLIISIFTFILSIGF
jgi:hypothetical protein